jgi:hypothetical protein
LKRFLYFRASAQQSFNTSEQSMVKSAPAIRDLSCNQVPDPVKLPSRYIGDMIQVLTGQENPSTYSTPIPRRSPRKRFVSHMISKLKYGTRPQ